MKSSGELCNIVRSLTWSDVHNLRRLGVLKEERRVGRKYYFSEKDAVLLELAYPAWKSGVKPKSAFKRAEADFEHFQKDLLEKVFEYRESHQGLYPSLNQLLKILPKAAI